MFNSSVEFKNFIENIIENIVDDVERNNLEYAKCRRYSIKNSEKYKEIISELPEEKRDFINEYNNNFCDMRSIEREEFYYRGGQDCIKFLKLFGLI